MAGQVKGVINHEHPEYEALFMAWRRAGGSLSLQFPYGQDIWMSVHDGDEIRFTWVREASPWGTYGDYSTGAGINGSRG